MYSLFNNNKP